MRRLLGKFTEMPVDVKLFHLSTLVFTDGAQEEFRNMLGSLSVELVRKKALHLWLIRLKRLDMSPGQTWFSIKYT